MCLELHNGSYDARNRPRGRSGITQPKVRIFAEMWVDLSRGSHQIKWLALPKAPYRILRHVQKMGTCLLSRLSLSDRADPFLFLPSSLKIGVQLRR